MNALGHIMERGVAARLPLDLALDIIPSLPRPLLARMVARMIDRLDELDGDTDLEPSGDEEDSSGAEDEYAISNHSKVFGGPIGAGCPIADGGE